MNNKILSKMIVAILTQPVQQLDDFCITALEDNCNVRFYLRNTNVQMQYNKNGTGWKTYTSSQSISLNTNQCVYFRNLINQFSTKNYNNNIYATRKYKVSGNIMSLLNYSNNLPAYSFNQLFYEDYIDNKLVNATQLELPAIQLTSSCYSEMFYNCSLLTGLPNINFNNVTLLENWCCNGMFDNCTSLSSNRIFEINTQIINQNAFNSMFCGCSSLTTIPVTLGSNVKKVLGDACNRMYVYSTNLTGNIILYPAQQLAVNSYNSMFESCNLTSLRLMSDIVTGSTGYQLQGVYNRIVANNPNFNFIHVEFQSWPKGAHSTTYWLGGVCTSGTFEKPTALPISRGSSSIPDSWDIVEF